MVIRVGNTRINLDNVAYVEIRMSDKLYHPSWSKDDRIYEGESAVDGQQYFTGNVAMISFPGDVDNYIRLYGQDADNFIELYDAFANTVDIETLRRQKGN